MSKRTLSIGGATYDLFVRLPKTASKECDATKSFALPLGGKIRVEDLVESAGGGACNTSVGLSRLGMDACFEGILSSDQWGEALLEHLQSENVHTDCITIVEDEVSSFSIILSGESGERVILYEPGTNTHLHDVTFDKEFLSTIDWVYLNHLQEDSCIIQNDIVEMLSGKDTKLTWNPGGCQIDMGLKPETNREFLTHTDLLLLNKQEAMTFTKKDSGEHALRALIDAGAANVVITDGGNGVVASDGTNCYHCDVMKGTKVVDTTGAGDAFGTGVTWGLLQGFSLPEALKTGTINGASVVSAIGAQTGLLTDTEIRQRLETCDLTVTQYPLSSIV